jgi:hypothetical protein
MLTQFLEDAVAICLRFHVDEIADDDSADISQPELTGNFLGRLHVGSENGLLRILLASVSTRLTSTETSASVGSMIR